MLQQTQHSAAATSRPLLYVQNTVLRHEQFDTSLLGFDVNANGNVPPVFKIGGKQFRKSQLRGVDTNIVADKSGRVYSTGPNLDAIAVWAARSNGDVTWTTYFDAGCDSFSGDGIRIALDRAGHVWVACLLGHDPDTSAIREYQAVPAGAKGHIALNAMRKITGSKTGLSDISAIALNGKGQIAVETSGAILTFADTARGNVAPLSTLSGENTQLAGNDGGTGMQYDSLGRIVACNYNYYKPSVLTFAPGAQGNVAPISTLAVPTCSALTLDSQDNIYIGYKSSVLVYAAGAAGTAQPIRTIRGSQTTLSGAASVAF